MLGFNSFSQEFSFKENMSTNRMRSSSDYRKTIKFADLFNFPSEIDVKSEISTNTDITINFVSTNESTLLFDGYYHSSYSGQFFYYKIPANAYGKDTLTININYNGINSSAKVILDIDPIQCKDDEYDLNIGDTLEITVTNNDSPRSFLEYSSFEIIQSPMHGTEQITNDGTIKYINATTTENYTSDTIIYRIADADSNYDTANVILSVHNNSYVSKVFDFLPAPGQFVNTGYADTAAAKGIIGDSYGAVSLGGFGGYIIAGFDQPIINRDNNPYGVDFTVVGNAFGGWGEPAAVQVMKDVNKNGLPDDNAWYELAGSEYHFQSSIKDLKMTYINPKYNERHTIPFKTDKGFNGAMRTNGFHAQQYYPDPHSFGISPDSVSYKGTYTKFLLDKSKPNLIVAKRLPAFGYADCRPANRNPTNPLNPYFKDENGKAADGFDLEWAVDENGNHIELDTIHFVKVYSTVQEDGGWLGEISPEITKIAITTPDPSYVTQDYEFHAIGAAQLQVLKGTNLQLEGLLFKNGVPQSGTANWSSDSTHVATIDNTGLLSALKCGQTTINFHVKESIQKDSLVIEVVELQEVVIELEGNSATANDTLEMIKGELEYIHAESIDNRTGDRNRYVYENFIWSSSNENIGTIENGIFNAKNTGETTVVAKSFHHNELADTIIVIVNETPEIQALKDTIVIPYYERSGSFENNELFTNGVNAIVTMKSKSGSSLIMNSDIENNVFKYNILENEYGFETIDFTVESFGNEKNVQVVFHAIKPDNLETPKQILFTNGGEFMNPDAPTELKSYIPSLDTTIQIDNYLAGATSVQDMLVDGNFAYVSADYYITRYNISARTATDSIYTQDLDPNSADGQGTDMAGVNHKLAVYQNMLLATRQNSAAPPEDGYNVRIYNKGDLSLITKIPVSDQATDIVVVGDTAFVMINGGFAGQTSSIAVIDLNTLTLNREVDLGIAGLGVMQMVVKDEKIYCIRLKDFMERFEAGIVIYDITTGNIQEFEYQPGIPYDSSPLAIEPMTNDTLFVKKDKGYIAFNTSDLSFGNEVLMNIPSNYTQDLDHIGRGSVYDPEDEKYYVAYAYWHGSGIGQVYDNNMDSIGTFKGVGASPEVMKVCNASPDNEKPYINKKFTKTYNEGQEFNFSIWSSTFKDIEDNNATSYMYNPLQFDWLTYNPTTRRFTGKYDNEILETTIFNVLIQGIDNQGAFAIDTVKITIKPVDDPMTIGELIPDITVQEDAADSLIDLTKTFIDTDNAIITTVLKNSNPTLFSSTISNNILTLNFSEEQNGDAEIIIEAESNGVVLTDTFNITVTPVDDAPFVANHISDITVNEDETIASIDISNVFDDIDNDNTTITKTVKNISNNSLLTASISENKLAIELIENQFGESEIVIEATSNGLSINDTLIVTINPLDDAPTLVNPVSDITANEDENISLIDISNVFDDIDNDNSTITKTVKNISNNDLLTASISENNLTIDLIENQFGESEIVIEAKSNELSITDTLIIKINPVNDAPTVAETIEDINVDMNAKNQEIDLSTIFEDIDSDDLEISVSNNTNENVVKSTINSEILTVSFVQNQYGNADITLMANDGSETISTTFNVNVKQTTGIDYQDKLSVKIYPNPVLDVLHINYKSVIKRVIVYNSIGNIQKIVTPENKNNCEVNISSLPSGSYFISIEGENNKTTRTIIKQ